MDVAACSQYNPAKGPSLVERGEDMQSHKYEPSLVGWARQVEEFSHVVPSEQMVTVEGSQVIDLFVVMVVVVLLCGQINERECVKVGSRTLYNTLYLPTDKLMPTSSHAEVDPDYGANLTRFASCVHPGCKLIRKHRLVLSRIFGCRILCLFCFVTSSSPTASKYCRKPPENLIKVGCYFVAERNSLSIR
jgi:hypothetical protein